MEDYVWIEHDIDERLIALGFEPARGAACRDGALRARDGR